MKKGGGAGKKKGSPATSGAGNGAKGTAVRKTNGAASSPVAAYPRQMQPVPVHGARSLRKSVKVMTYNVLKASCSFSFYQHCDSQHMLFNYRLNNQSREIDALGPDVVCMQEVEKYQEYLSYLSKTYSGIYKKREKGDGCAIFYNRERYYPAETKELDLGYDTVAILVQLMPLADNDGPLLIATTHLSVWFDDTESEEIRLKQAYELMSVIDEWRKEKDSEAGEELPVVLCGDFNSTPESPVYSLLTTGRMPTSASRQARGGRAPPNKGAARGTASSSSSSSSSPTFKELAPWRSAYALHQRAGDGDQGVGEPPYTTLLPNAAGQVVDYILWPATSSMRVRSLLEIPSMPEGTGLPNAVYSSDHFSLMCEFE